MRRRIGHRRVILIMNEPIISTAGVEDASAILDLQKLAYQSEACLYDDWSIPPLTQTLEGIRTEFDGKVFLKASHGSSLVGSVRAAYRNDVCEIGRLVVHPEYQRQSIGTRLMHAVEALFPHAARFELFTGERSVGNIRLYERLGYRIVRSERLSPAVTLVYMEKRQESRIP
jgi:ribosomal protein S18 acetylase RimI-like enzyme